jgi:uncharacterized membrane protein
MRSLAFTLLVGIFGAAFLHIVIILALPHFAEQDAWSRAASIDVERFVRLDAAQSVSIEEDLQPFAAAALCRFDLADEPLQLTASGDVPFWSLSIFDRWSNEIFSMNDRTAVGRSVDVVVATPLAMIGLRDGLPPGFAQSVLVEMAEGSGYVVLRTVAPDDTWDAAVDRFMASAQCRRQGV